MSKPTKPAAPKDPAVVLDRLAAGIHRELAKASSTLAAALGEVEAAVAIRRTAAGLEMSFSFAGADVAPAKLNKPVPTVSPTPDTAPLAASGNEPVVEPEPVVEEPAAEPVVEPLDLPPIPARGRKQSVAAYLAEVAAVFRGVALEDVATTPEDPTEIGDWEDAYAGPATPVEILEQAWWAWLYASIGPRGGVAGDLHDVRPLVRAPALTDRDDYVVAYACKLSATGRRLLGLAPGDPRETEAVRGRLGSWIAPRWWLMGEAPADRDARDLRYHQPAAPEAVEPDDPTDPAPDPDGPDGAPAEPAVEAPAASGIAAEEAAVEEAPAVVQVARMRPAVAVVAEPAPLRRVEEPVASSAAVAEAVARARQARPDVAITTRPGIDPGSVEVEARMGEEVRSVTIFRGDAGAAGKIRRMLDAIGEV